MKIDNIKELQRLIKLCRLTGVEAIEVDGIKMNLGPTPTIISNKRQKVSHTDNTHNTDTPANIITEDMRIPTDGLTDEQLLFYSSQGPLNNEQQ